MLGFEYPGRREDAVAAQRHADEVRLHRGLDRQDGGGRTPAIGHRRHRRCLHRFCCQRDEPRKPNLDRLLPRTHLVGGRLA